MMRAILPCTSLLIALGGVSLAAQEPPSQGKAPIAGTASQDQPRIPLLESIATLEKSLDTKKLKVGDEVGFKLGQDLKSGDIVVAKNSRLVGHVAELKSRQSDHPGTRLTIVFDRIVKKDGGEIPVYGVVQSVRGTTPTPGEYEISRQMMDLPSAPKRITDDGRVVSTGRPQEPIPGPPISMSRDSSRRTSPGDGTKDVMVVTERSPQGLKAALVSDKDGITLSAGTVIVVKLGSRR